MTTADTPKMKVKLFIPGLGGAKTIRWQSKVVASWKRRNVASYLFEPRWHTDESSEDKLQRLITFIDENDLGDSIDLSGASAGGPLAMSLLDAIPERISRLTLVCPKLKGSDTIGPAYQESAPALLAMVQRSERAMSSLDVAVLEKATIYRPITERVVPLKDMIAPHARMRRLPLVGHVFTIAFSIIFILRW